MAKNNTGQQINWVLLYTHVFIKKLKNDKEKKNNNVQGPVALTSD